MSLINLTAKQIHDLNWMNEAARRCQLGTLMNTLISATINANVAMTSDALASATGTLTLTLSEAITGLALGDFAITKDGVALTATTHYTVADLGATAPTIEFKAAAGLTSASVITVYITKASYFVNYGDALAIVNSI